MVRAKVDSDATHGVAAPPFTERMPSQACIPETDGFRSGIAPARTSQHGTAMVPLKGASANAGGLLAAPLVSDSDAKLAARPCVTEVLFTLPAAFVA